MAANGRIKDSGGGQTTLAYTIDGISPTYNGRKFGYYSAGGSSSGSHFVPVGLYQLAEVTEGVHTVQLEGEGSSLDLNFVTSQVATVPVDNVHCVITSTADQESIETPKLSTASLLKADVVVTTESVLVISTLFSVHGMCAQSEGYYQIMVNGNMTFENARSSHSHLGVWHERRAGDSAAMSSSPASLLVFARVGSGAHRIDLVVVNKGPCACMTTGAVLQVGAVPDMY